MLRERTESRVAGEKYVELIILLLVCLVIIRHPIILLQSSFLTFKVM